MASSQSAPNLPTAPSPAEVDAYLKSFGMTSTIVGNSYQGRDIVLYEYHSYLLQEEDAAPDNNVLTVLFISLVHGDEIMGLLALLKTVHEISQPDSLPNQPLRILLLPIINIDAYTLNLEEEEGGCRRTNLRSSCNYTTTVEYNISMSEIEDDDWTTLPSASCSAPWFVRAGGVDLNRNHPIDWDHPIDMVDPDEIEDWRLNSDCNYECGSNYHGNEPWSESESRAIRDVVLSNNITAAISFHSRHTMHDQPLLIHPYTSARSFSNMPTEDQNIFRSWSQQMNDHHFYQAGTAAEAIHYTAGGSTIDWMYSVGIKSFVVETVPPCYDRWCKSLLDEEIWEAMKPYGITGHQLVQLALGYQLSYENTDDLLTFSASGDCSEVIDRSGWVAVMQLVGLVAFVLIMFRIRNWRKHGHEHEYNEAEQEEEGELKMQEVEMENIT
jgi:hypothetical protein